MKTSEIMLTRAYKSIEKTLSYVLDIQNVIQPKVDSWAVVICYIDYNEKNKIMANIIELPELGNEAFRVSAESFFREFSRQREVTKEDVKYLIKQTK